jgi:hypothetical protein
MDESRSENRGERLAPTLRVSFAATSDSRDTRRGKARLRLDVARHTLSGVEGCSMTAAMGWGPYAGRTKRGGRRAFPRDVRGSKNEMRDAGARRVRSF